MSSGITGYPTRKGLAGILLARIWLVAAKTNAHSWSDGSTLLWDRDASSGRGSCRKSIGVRGKAYETNEDDEDRGFINAKDFMQDFATENFRNMIVRVKPQVEKGENMEDTRGAGDVRLGGNAQDKPGQEDGGDEKNFDYLVNADMEEQRKNIKIKVRLYINNS